MTTRTRTKEEGKQSSTDKTGHSSAKSQDRTARRSERIRERPGPSSKEHPVVQLQWSHGNQAVQRLVRSGAIQAKLRANGPGDRYEQEADRVTEEVVGPFQRRDPVSDVSRPAGQSRGASPDEQPVAETVTTNPAGISASDAGSIRGLRGGRPLPEPLQSTFEARFGADLSDVRVHSDTDAGVLSTELNAAAFTYGHDIYFGFGRYRPNTRAGRRLLAHELTHVVQQDGTRGVVQRQRQESAIEGRRPQQPPAPTASERSGAIDRDWLIQRIGFRMGIAFSKFVDACSEHQRRLREIAADKAEMAGLVLDVVLSFATPGLGRMITRAISRSVPTDASTAVYRLALSAMDRSDQIVSATTAVGKDIAKNAFKAAVARDEEEQFVQALKQRFSVVLDRIHGNLVNKTDEELSVLYVNYDPEIATFDYYEQQIGQLVRRYQAQVAPIGRGRSEVSQAHVLVTENHAYWIELPQGTYLGLVETPEIASFGFPARLRFLGWIGQSMADLAIEKTKQATGREPRRVSAADVYGIPIGNLVSGRPPVTRL